VRHEPCQNTRDDLVSPSRFFSFLKAAFSGPTRWPRIGLVLVIVAFLASRGIYWHWYGIRFEDNTILDYMQYIDPVLLKTQLLRCIYYLRDQPPLFNFFLGSFLQLFPVHSHEAFAVVYFACGLTLVTSMYLLMLRLRVPWALAAFTAIFFTTSPTTVLYENWLFYTYPVATLLLVAALFLHRFLEKRAFRDALAFFALLATVVLIRGIFHFVWILALTAALLLFCWKDRRVILRAAAAPLALVLAFYVKTYVVFGGLVSGQMYQQINLAGMTVNHLPDKERQRLIKEKKLSPVTTTPVGDYTRLEVFADYIPKRPPTGIPMLDQLKKSSGYTNWQHSSTVDIAALYGRDGVYVLKHYPKIYLDSLLYNVSVYFLPSSYTYPFGTGSSANERRIRPYVYAHDKYIGCQLTRPNTAWTLVVVFPACMLFATGLIVRWLRRRRPIEDLPRALTVLYAWFNVFYVALVTILFSWGDHNRYRFKVTPLYCVLCAMLVSAAWSLAVRLVRRLRKAPSPTTAAPIAPPDPAPPAESPAPAPDPGAPA
jgi:Dolichyl-phosphate-mannose-protein mannosyltransferase